MRKRTRSELEATLARVSNELNLWRCFAYDLLNGRALAKSVDDVTLFASRPAAPSGGVVVLTGKAIPYPEIDTIDHFAESSSLRRSGAWNSDEETRRILGNAAELGQAARRVQILACDENCLPLVVPSRLEGFKPLSLSAK